MKQVWATGSLVVRGQDDTILIMKWEMRNYTYPSSLYTARSPFGNHRHLIVQGASKVISCYHPGSQPVKEDFKAVGPGGSMYQGKLCNLRNMQNHKSALKLECYIINKNVLYVCMTISRLSNCLLNTHK